MYKKYIVRLSDEERSICQEVIKKLKGSSQKARRAQVLLKADIDGPGWPDAKIAEAFDCRVQTIENLRKRLVTENTSGTLLACRYATFLSISFATTPTSVTFPLSTIMWMGGTGCKA